MARLEQVRKDIESEQQKPELEQNKKIPKHNLKFTDVLVVDGTIGCSKKGHQIVPCQGIVPLLDKNKNVIEYPVYLGFCRSCSRYTMFMSDYIKMLETGKPLCSVINVYKNDPIRSDKNKFHYKSQSVLNALGYNVQSSSRMNQSGRQAILSDAIDSKIVGVQDVLDFLEWLIRTRRPMRSMENAIIKWTEDRDFIKKNYMGDEKIGVDTLIVRSKRP